MAYYDPQSMHHDPYDLTILYMEDAREWCEYLFDLFQPYDVHQNSEDITVFPTQEATLEAIRTSQVRIIIISPTFIERCTTDLERQVPSKSVVGLLCGVTRSELHSLDLRVPSYKQWELIEAQSDAKDLTQVTMKMLQDSMKEFETDEIDNDNDGNSVYMPMIGNVIRKEEEEDLYVAGPQDDSIQDMYGPIDDLQTVIVCPDRIHVKHQKNFYVTFSYEALEKGSNYLVKVTGDVGCTHTDGIAQNPYVLCVNTPEDIAPGAISMEITSQGKTVAKCTAALVTPMDEVAENLKNALEPMNFICESLGISPASSNDLDNLLFNHVIQFQDSSMLKNALTSSQKGKQAKSDKLYPTALHFTANFGLKTVTNYLMGLPGADHALKVKNRDNFTPADMAKGNGHEDLSDIMTYPTESPTSVTTNQGYVKMMTAIPPGYHRPRPPDKDELHRMLDSGNIYDVFYPKNLTRIEDEDQHKSDYQPVESDLPLEGPALPNPITPTLPPHVTPQTAETPDFQKELWEIDQRMKNQKISLEEAHKEFENWRIKYMQHPKTTTVATQKLPPAKHDKPKKNPFGLGKSKQASDSPREQRTQSTISRPILSSSHSVPQSTSTPSYLRAVSVPGTGQDVRQEQPPPTRRQPDQQGPVRQRTPLRPVTKDGGSTTRRRSSGNQRLSFPDMSDYHPPSRDPPPIPSGAQPPPRISRRPIPAPRPDPSGR